MLCLHNAYITSQTYLMSVVHPTASATAAAYDDNVNGFDDDDEVRFCCVA